MKTNTKGFTLIELLVVISIIALLSSVVLSSLNAARTKSADAAVKADLKQLHNQSQVYLDTNNAVTFGTAANCTTASTLFTDAKVTEILAHVQTTAGSAPTCGSTGNKWAVSVTLKSGTAFCTDNSQGWFKAGTANTSTGLCQ
jgi:prepilin-type N-terminal cleavage/methylation domain-containing protein